MDEPRHENPHPPKAAELPPTVLREAPLSQAGPIHADSDRTIIRSQVGGDPSGHPNQLGAYELLEELARGGMGVVYRARDVNLQRIVALKMILHGHLANADNLHRFHLEAAATAQLQHPGIVAIYEVDCQDGQPFFIMEFVDGINLAQRVAAGPLAGPVAANYLEKIARAVHFAHVHGILHRDLKPANVLLDQHDQPKVTDFGLAKVLLQDSGQTRSGAILGTPSYMAPEQALARKDLKESCDVYSLGAILYELLTGRPPFQGENAMATMALVIETDPVPPRLLNPKVNRDLETICLRCLEKEPGRRYPSALALADDLRNYLEEKPIDARRPGAWGRVWKWCRRQPAVAALTALSVTALLALVLGGVTFGLLQNQLREDADREAGHARQAEKKAREAEETARKAEKKADSRYVQARYLLYAAQFSQARKAWEANGFDRAQVLLNGWKSPPHNAGDPRGWEWYFLQELCSRDDKRENRVLEGHDRSVNGLAFSPDGTRLVSAAGEEGLRLWNLAEGKLQGGLRLATAKKISVVFSPDGNLAVAADNTVYIYDQRVEKVQLELLGHQHTVLALAYSSDGSLLASGDEDGVIRLWNTATGAEQGLLGRQGGRITALAFSPRENLLAFADSEDQDKAIHLWDPIEKRKMGVLKGHTRGVTSVAFSSNGSRLASGGLDRTVRLWDVEQRRELTRLDGHTEAVYSVSFHPKGNRLASGGADGAVRIWDTTTNQELLQLDGVDRKMDRDAGAVACVRFSRDGHRLAAAGQDKKVRVWEGR